jgi:predicted dehydrogenase
MGEAHLAAYAAIPGVTVVGIATRTRERGEALARRHGAEAVFGDATLAVASDGAVALAADGPAFAVWALPGVRVPGQVGTEGVGA